MERVTSKISGDMFVTRLARSFGILEKGDGNFLMMVPTPPFSLTLYRRVRIIEDYGGGHIGIPNEDVVLVPEESGRRVRPHRENIQEKLLVIPVDDEIPMDWYNMELRRYQDDLRRSMNYHKESFVHLFNQMNLAPRDGPGYPYVRSWKERISQCQNQSRGSGGGEDEEEDGD